MTFTNYYVNPPNFLQSITYQDNNYGHMTPPYLRYGGIQHRRDKPFKCDLKSPIFCMGYKWGFKLYGTDPTYQVDTLNSEWETFFPECNPRITLNSLRANYDNIIGSSDGFQPQLDIMKKNSFYDSSNSGYLYSGKIWWQWFLAGSDWGIDSMVKPDLSIKRYAVVSRRPECGEEIRQLFWTGLISGAKGFILDREYSEPRDTLKDKWIAVGLGQSQEYYNTYKLDRLDSRTFLESDSVGTDFLNLNHDYSLINYLIDTNYVRDSMDLNPHRIYLGRKSTRLETKKIYDFCKSNDSLIMNLRLACWYGKGFKSWYNQDTLRFGNDTILKKFMIVDTPFVKVRKLDRANYEAWDSTFFDLTLLRNKNDSLLTSDTIYLGILNRRVDPLFRNFDIISTNPEIIDSTMKFYSTAEFDKYVQFGGKRINGDSMPASYWRDLFWKRQGCREITIPFHYIDPNVINNYTLLKIEELGAKDTSITNQYWMKQEYHHTIDTVIGQDKKLVVIVIT